MTDVVTGDAVVVEVQIAQLPVRAVGAMIDIAVIFTCYILGLTLALALMPEFDDALATAFVIIFTVLALVGYPVIFETASRGRSLGKLAMGLRVVSDDGGPERFRQALFRALAAVVEIWLFFGSPAVICSLLSSKGKRIGDVFAGTVVITERGPKLEPPPAMPPALAGWASSLQLSGLRPETAQLARQFLSRETQLHPQVRHQMAHRIITEVAAQISPPPPPGVPPQYVLAAVLAERHRRELMRLWPSRPPGPIRTPPPPVAQSAPPPPPAQPEPGGFAPPS